MSFLKILILFTTVVSGTLAFANQEDWQISAIASDEAVLRRCEISRNLVEIEETLIDKRIFSFEKKVSSGADYYVSRFLSKTSRSGDPVPEYGEDYLFEDATISPSVPLRIRIIKGGNNYTLSADSNMILDFIGYYPNGIEEAELVEIVKHLCGYK